MENKVLEKEKYYTPSIEEFHVGFEYEMWETHSKLYDRTIDDSKWVKKKHDIRSISLDKLSSRLKDCKVKYLDREDIESLGFKKRLKDEWIGWRDYALDTVSGELPYFLSATIHEPRMDDIYKIYVHRYLDNDTRLNIRISEGESELVYKGKIKNKSELKKLLIQLGIN